MIWSLTRPTEHALERVRVHQSDLDTTYAERGASLGRHPDGFTSDRATLAAGHGRPTFEAGASALRAWAGHRALGMALAPSTPPLVEGTTMVFALRVFAPLPLWVTGACRIVRVVDEPRRFGFAYGTLPHHPECGEEVFLVHHRQDDSVLFEIAAFSRPASTLVRLGGPVGRHVQQRSTRRYLEGFRAYAHGTRPRPTDASPHPPSSDSS